jgi:hypothetical protein
MTIVVLLNAESAETMLGATALLIFVPLRITLQPARMALEYSAYLDLEKLALYALVENQVSRAVRLGMAGRRDSGEATETCITNRLSNNYKQRVSSYLCRGSGGAASCPLKGVEFGVANREERRRNVGEGEVLQ